MNDAEREEKDEEMLDFAGVRVRWRREPGRNAMDEPETTLGEVRETARWEKECCSERGAECAYAGRVVVVVVVAVSTAPRSARFRSS